MSTAPPFAVVDSGMARDHLLQQPGQAPATLTMGFSPCPNDCFLFYALAHGRVGEDSVDVHMADVEELNQQALRGALDLSKLSYHAYAHVADRYVMLPAGGAMGKGVGPLIVSRDPLPELNGRTVATPGGLTTASLLLELSQPDDIDYREMRYDLIMPAVARGEVDAGLIIHESRFTFEQHGLRKHLDLGEWWERTTGRLLPLGGVVARRALGEGRLGRLSESLRASMNYAFRHRDEVEQYVARHAQEMSRSVRQRHIELYVNEWSRDPGEEGREAVRELFSAARERGLIPDYSDRPLFAE